jgi:hypothetical protein
VAKNVAPEPEDDDVHTDDRIELLAALAGMPSQHLQVLAERRVELPDGFGSVRKLKLLDRGSGRSIQLTVDDDDNLVEPAAAELDDDGEVRGIGRVQPELQEAIDLAETDNGGDRLIPVLIKYVIAEEEIDRSEFDSPDGVAFDDMQELAESAMAAVADEARRLHASILGDAGAEVVDDPEVSGPFATASLTADQLHQLADDDRVAFIGLDGEAEVLDHPTIPESLPTTYANIVQSSGATGAGIKIAVLESGGLWKNASCFNIADTQDPNATVSRHMTMSVGIIGNRYNDGACDGDWEGYAPDADVYLANGANYRDRYDWARERGVNVVTMSWHFPSEESNGSLHSRDVYFDYWAQRWPYPSIFTSAGNQADEEAYASGKGYNFVGVGNVLNDGNGDRSNDVISDSSSWLDPTSPHSDREIPEIAAPGSRHELLGSTFGGTSCATPVTASIAALLMSRNTSLKIWPEAIRAILLATANYQDADGANWSPSADGKDGTGLINAIFGMWTADRRETTAAAQFRAHDYGRITDADFVDGFYKRSWTAKIRTTQGKIRVALTWNSKVSAVDGVPTSSALDADLDLWVRDPSGAIVATSSSWDSNYEFIEFTPTVIGNYEISIRGFTVPSGFANYFGLAWTAHYD